MVPSHHMLHNMLDQHIYIASFDVFEVLMHSNLPIRLPMALQDVK